MPIEDSLERIAIALEAIVKSKQGEATQTKPVGSLAKAELVDTPKTRPGKKVEEKAEERLETATTSEDDSIPEEFTDPDIKWPDVNKKLFGMLAQVRDVKGGDAAKATCAALMKKYSGGQKFGPGTVAPKTYTALLADIEKELEALNG